MKLFAVFATVLVVAITINGVQSAAARRAHEVDDVDAEDDESVVPRKFFSKFDKLAALKGDHKEDDKEIVVVYVNNDDKHRRKHHGSNHGSNHGSHGSNHGSHGSHGGHGGHWDSSEEYGYKKPVKKVRPVKWESYEDSDEYEYVRPIRVHKKKTSSYHSKPHRVVKPVYVTSWDDDNSDHKDDHWTNWGNWFGKFGNKGNKGHGSSNGNHGGNKWGHDASSEEHYVYKRKGGNRWTDDDSYEHGYNHGSHGSKWSKYD